MSRILITGASGQLGSYLLREAGARQLPIVAWTGSQTGSLLGVPLYPVDLRDRDAVARGFRDAQPEVVIHTAALARVDACHSDPQAAHAINAGGSAHVAAWAATCGARLVHVSTDLVFDGERAPYREDDPPAPLSVYGQSKAEAECQVLRWPDTVVVRVSLLYGPSLTGRATLFDKQRQAAAQGQPLTLFEDEWRTPLDLASAARSLLGIAASNVTGTLHVGGPERLSRREMGERLARVLGGAPVVVPLSRNHGNPPEPRARDVSLDSSRWRTLFPDAPWPLYTDAVRHLLASQ